MTPLSIPANATALERHVCTDLPVFQVLARTK